MTLAPLETSRLRANVAAIRVMNFTWMFMLIMPVVVPFFGELGLTPGEVFEVQAIFGLAIVLLEVPTGYVSDLVGRKGCLVLAALFHGLAVTWLTFASGYWGIVGFELIAAVAVCLYSGTDVALLYDSLEALDQHGDRRRGLGKRLFYMQAGETSAALVGGWLAVSSLQRVAFWNAVVGWLPLFAALALTEVRRPQLASGRHLENVRMIWDELFVQSVLVRQVMINLIVYGLSTLLAVWVFQGYWEYLEIDLAFFGYLWAGYNLVVALVGRVAHRIETGLGARATLLWIAALPVVGYAGMALVAGLGPGVLAATLGVGLGLLFQVGRGLTQVVLKDELNTRVRPALRATANSISSLGVRLGYALVGPALGWLIDGPGYGVALGTAAGVFALVGLALALPLAQRLGAAQAPRPEPHS